MEDNTPPSLTTGPPAANTAETLRALQERARAALAAQRARMGQLEVTLAEQLDLIEGAVASQLSTQAEQTQFVDRSGFEIERLQLELSDAQATLTAEREQTATAAAAVATRAQQLAQQRSELDARVQELTNGRRELESRQQALDDRATQLNARERELRKLQDELDARSQDCARQQSQLSSAESQLQQDRSDFAAKESALQASQQTLAMRETALQTSLQAQMAHESALQSSEQSLASREAALQNAEQQLANNLFELERRERSLQTEESTTAAERDRLQEQVAKLTAESIANGGELASQLADARQELAAQHVTWEDQQSELANERLAIQRARDLAVQDRDAAAAQLASLTAASQSSTADFANRLAAAEQQLEFQRSTWEGERHQLEVEVRLLSHERDELAAALTSARQQLESSRGQTDAATERDELQQKFELAIADMQRLRGRVAEMEQELASRPAVDQTDSVELVHLRSERDELVHRIAELEQQPAAFADSDSAQQIADLQRRFELAVEDVRDLKKQNAQLETQLAAAKLAPPVAASPTGGSWEAVKRQLLASLEGDSADATPERQKQISSIENTVRITDEVVANKDRQIAELKAQLASGGEVVAVPIAEVPDAVVDADVVIQKHRARIAQIEQEMEDKLRATEMALSMERAKIAREQAQLTELRIELESMRGPNGAIAEPGGSNAPKRRWLSKLGLGDEEKK